MSKFNAQEIIDKHQGRCKTRDGRDAVLYEVMDQKQWPVIGRVQDDGFDSWMPRD
jgi:hypothetical protein